MRYGSLGNGGRLAAMKVGDLYRLGHVRAVGTVLPVSWTEVADPDPDQDVIARDQLNKSFAGAEVTRSRRLEGCWWNDADDRFYVVSSNERDSNAPVVLGPDPAIAHDGQVWAYDPGTEAIELVAHIPSDSSVFDGPENITRAGWRRRLPVRGRWGRPVRRRRRHRLRRALPVRVQPHRIERVRRRELLAQRQDDVRQPAEPVDDVRDHGFVGVARARGRWP